MNSAPTPRDALERLTTPIATSHTEHQPQLRHQPKPMLLHPPQPLTLAELSSTQHAQQQGMPSNTHSELEIVQQPPSTWYKDQFGRKATFDVHVARISRGCFGCADQRHLNVHLLYESGKLVENQNILRVASGLCLNKNDDTVLAIRIMEVSKNHQNQRFRLQITLPQCPLKPLPTGGIHVISEPVLVLSKKNKRPVKSDFDDAQSKPVRSKKSKHLLSPVGSVQESPSPARSVYNTPTSLGKMQGAQDFENFPEPDGVEAQWASEVVRFRTPNESVCLWANAAFNFLNRLQWQPYQTTEASEGHMSDFLPAHAYQCPICNSRYSSKPTHRSDCDLALLLEQTGPIDDPHGISGISGGNAIGKNCIPQKEKLAHFNSQSVGDLAARPSLPEEGFAKIMGNNRTSQTSFGTMSVDILAKNLNLSSWEGYSSLSKIMFSLEADTKQVKENGFVLPQDKMKSDTSMGSMGSFGNNSLSFPAPAHSGQMSVSLSSLMSSVKDLSPDTAAFLQEQEAELTGDACLLRSLSKVSLSDFLPDGSSDRTNDVEEVRTAVSSVTAVVLDDSRNQITENAVFSIAGIDFRHCGYPAFDRTFTLVGFYFFSDSATEKQLRFLPNIYPLPPQMLQDLELNVSEWRRQPQMLHMRSGSDSLSLEHLKSKVIASITSEHA